jgi:hypothetical protein
MSSPADRAPGRARPAAGLLGLAAAVLLAGCPDRNRGVSPVGAGLYFPSGLALDPRVPEDTPARWLFVLNGNSDLVYNAGTLVPVDLDRFFREWMTDPAACFAGDAAGCVPGPPPGASGGGPAVGDVGAELSDGVPCRRNALKPQVVECEDTAFLEEDAAVRLGNFGTALRGWVANPDEPDPARRRTKLLAAVRGDPSVTVIDLNTGDPDRVPRLECGQGEDSGQYDERRCAGRHLLRHLRGDPDARRISSEPSNILVLPGGPYALVTHATRPELTLIDLAGQYADGVDERAATTGGSETGGDGGSDTGTGGDTGTGAPAGYDYDGDGCKGELCKDGVPAIVDIGTVFQFGGNFGGGWGLAVRPCFPGTDNVPRLTVSSDAAGEPRECGRPLIYAGFRTTLLSARLFISEPSPLPRPFDPTYLDLDTVIAGLKDRIAAIDAELDTLAQTIPDADARERRRQELLDERAALANLIENYPKWLAEVEAGQLTDDLPLPETNGAFLCDARLFAAGLFQVGGFPVSQSVTSALGDLAFSRDGNRLFAVQTNPGGLSYVDTSLDSRGQTRDQSAGLVELCAQPTTLALFSDPSNEFAAVTCYSTDELFVVDLGGVRVVANVRVGKGPHPMAVDRARQFIYVANTLDKTISVVDIAPTRPTRFSEVARIGLQVPYNR